MSVATWNGVNAERVLASNEKNAKTTTTNSMVPSPPAARRTPSGRQACGSVTGDGSEAAGMDVGEQDAARSDVEELVHQSLGPGAWHHGANGHPALPMKRRDRRALDAGRERHGLGDSGG